MASDAEKLLREIGREPVLARDEFVTLPLAESLQNRPGDALQSLSEGVERGENLAYRFGAPRELGFKTIADDDKLGPRFDDLLQQVRGAIKGDQATSLQLPRDWPPIRPRLPTAAFFCSWQILDAFCVG